MSLQGRLRSDLVLDVCLGGIGGILKFKLISGFEGLLTILVSLEVEEFVGTIVLSAPFNNFVNLLLDFDFFTRLRVVVLDVEKVPLMVSVLVDSLSLFAESSISDSATGCVSGEMLILLSLSGFGGGWAAEDASIIIEVEPDSNWLFRDDEGSMDGAVGSFGCDCDSM